MTVCVHDGQSSLEKGLRIPCRQVNPGRPNFGPWTARRALSTHGGQPVAASDLRAGTVLEVELLDRPRPAYVLRIDWPLGILDHGLITVDHSRKTSSAGRWWPW